MEKDPESSPTELFGARWTSVLSPRYGARMLAFSTKTTVIKVCTRVHHPLTEVVTIWKTGLTWKCCEPACATIWTQLPRRSNFGTHKKTPIGQRSRPWPSLANTKFGQYQVWPNELWPNQHLHAPQDPFLFRTAVTWTAFRWTAGPPKISFSTLRRNFFFPSVGSLLVESWWCSGAPGPSNVHVRSSRAVV